MPVTRRWKAVDFHRHVRGFFGVDLRRAESLQIFSRSHLQHQFIESGRTAYNARRSGGAFHSVSAAPLLDAVFISWLRGRI
jgi:hypothetical protein